MKSKTQLLFTILILLCSGTVFSQITNVKDINSGSSSGVSGSPFITMNNVLYFVGYSSGTDYELWRSDGTSAGTYLVKDINPGAGGSNIQYFYKVGNLLFFHANNGTNGSELWRSDGTAAGTFMLKDINPGTGSSYYGLEVITDINNNLIFIADLTGGFFTELWKSDGTAVGTVSVSNLPGFSINAHSLGFAGTNFYFVAENKTNSINSLFRTDGTTAGTIMLKSNCDVYGFNSIGNNAYLCLDNNFSEKELWISDGSVSGTVLLKDIYPGSNSGLSNPTLFYKMNNKLFFSANDGASGSELWQTDGTASGTTLLMDINPGSANGINNPLTSNRYLEGALYGTKLYFSANDASNGNELWVTDGTLAGTQLVKDIQTGANSSVPGSYFSATNYLYFIAYDGASGNELFRTDGTSAGTILLNDIYPGTITSAPANLIDTDQGLFFTANNSTNGSEVWRSDGSTAGTNLVMDLNSGGSNCSATAFNVVNNSLIFRASDGIVGFELFKISGITTQQENYSITDRKFEAFPNPTNGKLTIVTGGEKQLLEIYNALGILVIRKEIIEERSEIDLCEQANGIYFVKVGSGIKKIIKNR